MSEASRNRTRLAGLAVSALFVVLAGKAGYLSLAGGKAPAHASGQKAERVVRADIVDRNGELLATSVSSRLLRRPAGARPLERRIRNLALQEPSLRSWRRFRSRRLR